MIRLEMPLLRFTPVCLICLLLVAVSSCGGGYSGKTQPLAVNGVLDLRGWNFEKDGPVKLNGQWEYYWKRFLSAEDFRSTTPPTMTGFFEIPRFWNEYRIDGQEAGPDGFATYRLRIKTGPASSTRLAFRFPRIATAYRSFSKGHLVSSNGMIGTSRELSRPQYLPRSAFIEQEGDELELILHISNFHGTKGGPWLPIKLGRHKQIDGEVSRNLGLDLLVTGAFFIMGLYHLGIFWKRRRDASPLYLGLFCIAITIYTLIVGPGFIIMLLPDVPWRVYNRLEFSLLYMFIPLFTGFISNLYSEIAVRKIYSMTWIVGLVAVLLTVLLPGRLYQYLLPYYQIWIILMVFYAAYVVVAAVVKRIEGALIFASGFLVFAAIALRDVLYSYFDQLEDPLLPYGLLFFILSQAYLLSTRASHAYATAESLTEEMEARIAGRTRELRESREEAQARRRQLEALGAVSRRVAAAPDLVEVLTAVHYELMGQLGPLGVWLLLVDERNGELYSESYRPAPGHARSDEQHRLIKEFRMPLTGEVGGALYRVYAKKRPVLFQRLSRLNVSSVDQAVLDFSGVESFAHLPLIVRGNVIGIMAVGGMKKGILRRRDLPWLSLFAEQITDAVHSASLLARADAARAEIQELNEFSKELNATTELNTYLKSMADFVRKKYQADGMLVFRTDLQKASLVYLYDNLPEHLKEYVRALELPLGPEGGIFYKIFRRKKHLFVSRAMIQKDLFRIAYPGMEQDRKFFRKLVRAFLMVPLIAQDRVIGMVVFSSLGEGNELRRGDVPAVVRFCSQIAGGVYGSSLMKHIREKHAAAEEARREAEQARERAERERARVEDLNAFTRALSQRTVLTRILELTFGHFYDNYGAKQGILAVVDPERGDAYVYNPSETPTLRESERQVLENLRFPLDDPRDFISAVYRRNRTVYLSGRRVGQAGIPWQSDLLRRLDWGNDAVLVVPLTVLNEVTAILILRIHQDRPRLGRDDRADVKAIADQIAGAIHGSSLLRQLEVRTRELARANDKLQRMDKAKSRFFANISHEFRTPLTMLIAPLESMLGGDFGASVRADAPIFKSMLQNGLRLLRLINNLLDYTKIEAGRMSANKTRTDMSDLMAFYMANVRAGAEARKLSLELRDNCPGLQADVDRELFEKAVMNLFSNAIKFTSPGGRVTLEMDVVDENNFTIAVRDTGVGIPEDELELIFQRFARSEDAETREREGTGIGLSLTREIMELHGGTVTAESRPGEGSVFTMTLPIAKGAAPEESLQEQHKEEVREYLMADIRASYLNILEESSEIAPPAAREAVNGEYKILLVEDNPDMRGFLVMLLENEYLVHAAANGEDGLNLARTIAPDLIVSDVMMPVMDGNAMTRELKKDPRTMDIPVLMLSAKADVMHRIEGLQFGADDYLAKPFNSTELLTRVRNHIKGKNMEKELKREKKERDKEFQQASLIQSSILTPRETVLATPGLEIDFKYLPMNHEISGDYYHVSPLRGGLASVFVADATGHGTQAALTTMQMDVLYRQNLERKYPDERFEYINGKFASELRSRNFFTGIIVDIFKERLRYSSAGHPTQYLIQGGELRALRTPGGWIGMIDGQTYAMEELPLNSGDLLLLFTDGIFEVFNEEREEFGEERFQDLIHAGIRSGLFSRPVSEITVSLLAHVDEHRGESPFDDDITLFAIRVE